MGCHTYIYKKVTEISDCIRLIEGALKNANDTLNMYTEDGVNSVNDDTSQKDWELFMNDIKAGMLIYDPDYIFCYMSNGKWINRFELTLDDIVTECMTVIAKCQDILIFPYLHSFEELKKFIIDNSRFWGFAFTDYVSLEEGIPDNAYFITKIYEDEIYVNSDKIQCNAFKACDHFRIYGYPCENVYGCPWYYQSSPAGKPVFGWDNADDLIEFLEWYKTADQLNPQYDDEGELITTEPPEINGVPLKGYDITLYSIIRKFFKMNKGKNLLVHFG